MRPELTYLVLGLTLLLAIVLPKVLDRWAISAPMVLVAVGFALGFTPLPDGLPLDPQQNLGLIEHVTELVVIVALMGVGLALDRPLEPRKATSWRAWGPTWRMLAIAMPLCIALVALLGWAVGLAPAAALLLGAALAPTDPVLASDVQVAGPQTGEHEVDEPDEIRFALTSEAGFNDGLAFPFVHLAILVAAEETIGEWAVEWLGWHVIAKVTLGVVVGIAVGRLLAWIAFRAPSPSLRLAERGESLMALAALVSAYGAAELAGGYGFLAVFTCAMTFRSAERSHDYHAAMHEVVERLERLLTLAVLLVLGIAFSRGLLGSLDWRGVAIGLALILLIRPVSGLVALGRTPSMSASERATVASFGVRGIGSIYYLAYAAGHSADLAVDSLWSTVAFTVVASVLIHGVLATPVMRRLERRA